MLFSSLLFIFVFLPIVLGIYYGILRKRKIRNFFLLLVSLVFYAWGEPVYVFLMIGCIGVNYLAGRWIEQYRNDRKKIKRILVLAVSFNVLVLITFKYTQLALPVGISFFTFQGISYVVDIYRERGKALRNPLDVGLYISLFPQLVAGPIVRYETIADEIYNRCENAEDIAEGIKRFIKGLGKKVILSNNFALIADKAFGLDTGTITITFAWLGALAYALQIYYDFSGYSDMAIGLGRMFGFHFNENFNRPYLAKSISDFWRRWHISLGSWFRDYVYIPLGGSRVGPIKLIRNLFIVWALTGAWHGANWTFVVWGLYFGLFVLAEKSFKLEEKLSCHKIIAHLYTLIVVLVGWVIFRAATLSQAFTYIKAMFGLTHNAVLGNLGALYLLENFILMFLGIIMLLPFKRVHKQKETPLYLVGLGIVFLIATAYLVKGSYNPFIYFNF